MNAKELLPGHETVFTITGYYDGVRQGIANFGGQPSFFDCLYEWETGENTNLFWLTPILDEVFQLAQEDWAIWVRWDAAFRAGAITNHDYDDPRSLPEDRSRHDQLEEILAAELKTDPAKRMLRRGTFANMGPIHSCGVDLYTWRVAWTLVSPDTALP